MLERSPGREYPQARPFYIQWAQQIQISSAWAWLWLLKVHRWEDYLQKARKHTWQLTTDTAQSISLLALSLNTKENPTKNSSRVDPYTETVKKRFLMLGFLAQSSRFASYPICCQVLAHSACTIGCLRRDITILLYLYARFQSLYYLWFIYSRKQTLLHLWHHMISQS